MFGKKRRSMSDFDEEIQSHIDFEIEELMEGGLGEKEARYAALRKFGNVTRARERFYESGRWLWLDAIARDLRFAWRNARRRPGVALSIIALLALGTGGVTAVFNPIYSTVFAPLPFPQPEQLMRIHGADDRLIDRLNPASFRREGVLDRVFSYKAAYKQENLKIRIPDTGKELDVDYLTVTEDFFETLGVKPFMGSFNCNTRLDNGLVISHRLWRREFAQKTDAIGSHVLSASGEPFQIIGVMPQNFHFPFEIDFWQCGWVAFASSSSKSSVYYIGRLRSGISAGQAAEELRTVDMEALALSGRIIRSGAVPVLRPEPLQTFLYGDKRPMLNMLGVAAILFLALVCAGAVNLLIAQGLKRKQEIAARLIFGASRRNLVFQLLRETLPLVVIGGIAGLWLSEMASALIFAQMPELRGGAVNVPVKIAFLSALVMVVTLLGGLVPSLYATSLDLNAYLKAAAGEKRRFLSAREVLVGVQLSLSLALLIGGGVLIRSMMFNVDIPIGWSSRDAAVVSVIYHYQRTELYRDIRNELIAMPEVMAAGVFSPIPFSRQAVNSSTEGVYKTPQPLLGNSISVEMLEDLIRRQDASGIARISVSPGGFEALGIPLVIGRFFTEAEAANDMEAGDKSAVIINQALAERLWPGENPIGNVFYGGTSSISAPVYEVVGIVRNFHHKPGGREFVPAMYVPNKLRSDSLDFLVKLRPGASLQNFHSNIRQRLSGFSLDWIEARPLNEYVKDATKNQRLALQLLVVFAVLGIIVSGLAVYAAAALAASARTKEMGIRMAMGASAWDILKLAFWRGIRAIIVGLPFGLFLAWILTKMLARFLAQVNAGDTLAWLISCGALTAIAAVAAFIPALFAARANPMDAIRE